MNVILDLGAFEQPIFRATNRSWYLLTNQQVIIGDVIIGHLHKQYPASIFNVSPQVTLHCKRNLEQSGAHNPASSKPPFFFRFRNPCPPKSNLSFLSVLSSKIDQNPNPRRKLSSSSVQI
ncbi:hypothetical protein CsSME_00006056 [Camellia sinensis var. sinensis]